MNFEFFAKIYRKGEEIQICDYFSKRKQTKISIISKINQINKNFGEKESKTFSFFFKAGQNIFYHLISFKVNNYITYC